MDTNVLNFTVDDTRIPDKLVEGIKEALNNFCMNIALADYYGYWLTEDEEGNPVDERSDRVAQAYRYARAYHALTGERFDIPSCLDMHYETIARNS